MSSSGTELLVATRPLETEIKWDEPETYEGIIWFYLNYFLYICLHINRMLFCIIVD